MALLGAFVTLPALSMGIFKFDFGSSPAQVLSVQDVRTPEVTVQKRMVVVPEVNQTSQSTEVIEQDRDILLQEQLIPTEQ